MRLYVLVEGQTEDDFVKNVLAPHLLGFGFQDVKSVIVETSRDASGRKRKGGGSWKHWKKDLRLLTSQQKGNEARFTTLFDLYGLPRDFPGLRDFGNEADTIRRAESLERAMADDLGDWRLTPYLQRHEFEALVLAGLDELSLLLDAEEDLFGLEILQQEVEGILPEDVDDGPESAPSKRLEKHIPSYRKALHGPLVVGEVGLPALRQTCPRFSQWVTRLEDIGREASS